MAGTVGEFYGNDIVYRFNKRKRIVFGVVTESYEASSDVDDFDNLEKGQIRVWWFTSSRDQIWKQSKVRLLNRNIICGDIVRRFIQGQDTQRGYCKVAKQYVTLQIVGTDKVIENVCGTRLKPISKYVLGKTVCLENKYGRIQNVDCKVLMTSKCGSCVELINCCSSHAPIDDYWLFKRNRLYTDEFYPGQEVVLNPQYLTNATWIHRSKSLKRRLQSRTRFTIQSVEVEAIDVDWCMPTDSETPDVDRATISGDDIKKLKVLDNMDPHILDLTERMFLKLTSSDKIIKKQDWLRKQSLMYRTDAHKMTAKHAINKTSRFRGSPTQSPTTQIDSDEWWTDDDKQSDNESSSSVTYGKRPKKKRHWPPRPKEIVPGNTLVVEVLCFESKITVVWQDGTVEEDIPSTQLYYSMSLDDHEFFPGEWVVAEGNQNGEEYGAVQSVDHLERTSKVKWFKIYNKNGVKSEPFYLNTTELSVYDLQKHQKYQFRPGSVVYPTAIEENKMGCVLDSYPVGYVHVRWMDGSETTNWPQDLVPLLEAVYDIGSDTSTDYGPASWETESIVSVNGDIIQDETTLALMASKLDFIRTKMIYLREKFKQHLTLDNFMYMRDFLVMYDNSSYLDKLLGTSFFSRKSRHFRMLLEQVRERAKQVGIDLSGRIFNSDTPQQPIKIKNAEKENIEKVQNIESTLNEQISKSQSLDSMVSPEVETNSIANGNLCVELLSMLKARMDLAYAEIVSRIGGQEALMVMTKASESISVPTIASTSEEFLEKIMKPNKQSNCGEGYAILDEAPKTHHFYENNIRPTNNQTFYKAVNREVKLLEESLPPGVWVRGYSDRIDLMSVMIRGPSRTPYEDGLFLFDLQLGADYPHSPPSCHFISYSSERLNPNLYVEGKICVSLLGTWIGKGSEVWGPSSSLLQLIVSIQGLILVSEPYYNEAGYEKQVESQQGYENSRTYNELVILKLVQAMTVLLISPPDGFKNEILSHFAQNGSKFCDRIEMWTSKTEPVFPDFPLLPVSKGFLLSLQCSLASFKEISSKAIEDYNNSSNTS